MSTEKSANTIFSRAIIKEKVKILPNEIGSNIRDVIMAKVQNKLEGFCSRHGFVRPGSVKIIEMSPGRIEGSSLNGDTLYNVSVLADICNPVPGQVVPSRIVNSNKFGLLAHSGIEIDGKYTTIMEIVITRHNYHGGSSETVPVDSVRVGDDVFIEVLGKTFELNDTKISLAGRLLRAVGTGSGKRVLLSTAVINADLDDVNVDVADADVVSVPGEASEESEVSEDEGEGEKLDDGDDDDDVDVDAEDEDDDADADVDVDVDVDVDEFEEDSMTVDDDDFSSTISRKH